MRCPRSDPGTGGAPPFAHYCELLPLAEEAKLTSSARRRIRRVRNRRRKMASEIMALLRAPSYTRDVLLRVRPLANDLKAVYFENSEGVKLNEDDRRVPRAECTASDELLVDKEMPPLRSLHLSCVRPNRPRRTRSASPRAVMFSRPAAAQDLPAELPHAPCAVCRGGRRLACAF